ncbi:thioesterase domain-containing protein [Paenibacillus typhae]|uniref:thioesterase domain-containing protein n=1 Tax=Paenibacillus typhae TaxID=1174501 RepID=UPI001C8D6FA2|nr:thioesterase domain-containing protein [Paenibacillus typhae]MBY0012810.1 hypothetical protein [Paenibacillus typhae]
MGGKRVVPGSRRQHRPLLIKKAADSNKSLFFIHDGTGRIEGYFNLCVTLKPEFNVYGILPDEDINGIPKELSIFKLARSYIKQIREIQPSGPYFLAGWSIGGTITFEMACQMEEEGDEVSFCGLFDPPPPGYYLIEGKDIFTVHSELERVRPFIKSKESVTELARCSDCEEFWSLFIKQCTVGQIDIDSYLTFMSETWPVQDITDSRMPLLELIQINNNIRALHEARVRYIPYGKLKTSACLFRAAIPGIKDIDNWEMYCGDLQTYTLDGDHYSIFNNENSKRAADLLNTVLDSC